MGVVLITLLVEERSCMRWVELFRVNGYCNCTAGSANTASKVQMVDGGE